MIDPFSTRYRRRSGSASAEGIAGAERRLEIHFAPELLRTPKRLDHDVEGEPPVPGVDDRQADAVHGDRVADRGGEAALDDKLAVIERGHMALLAHDAGEHAAKATPHTNERAW